MTNTPDAAERAAERIRAGRWTKAEGDAMAAIIREEYAEELAALEADKRELGVMLERVIMRIVPDTPIYNDARSLLERMKGE